MASSRYNRSPAHTQLLPITRACTVHHREQRQNHNRVAMSLHSAHIHLFSCTRANKREQGVGTITANADPVHARELRGEDWVCTWKQLVGCLPETSTRLTRHANNPKVRNGGHWKWVRDHELALWTFLWLERSQIGMVDQMDRDQ